MPAQKMARPNLRAAYSDRDALQMAQLSEFAYNQIETAEGRIVLKEQLSKAGFSLINIYHTGRTGFLKRSRGTEAYLCESDEMFVLAFRGSTDGRDLLTNLNIFKQKLEVGQYDNQPQYVKAHRGFYLAFKEHIKQMDADLQKIIKSAPDKPIFITGHSLGGALAQLATLTYSCDQIGACYTFGSPRAGNRSLDRFVKPPHYRVTNEWDSVPFVPAFWLGYRHTGDARSIVGLPPRLLRHSRGIFQQWLIVILRVLAWPFTLLPVFQPRSFFLLQQHAIATYVERLDILVRRRADLEQEPPVKLAAKEDTPD